MYLKNKKKTKVEFLKKHQSRQPDKLFRLQSTKSFDEHMDNKLKTCVLTFSERRKMTKIGSTQFIQIKIKFKNNRNLNQALI